MWGLAWIALIAAVVLILPEIIAALGAIGTAIEGVLLELSVLWATNPVLFYSGLIAFNSLVCWSNTPPTPPDWITLACGFVLSALEYFVTRGR